MVNAAEPLASEMGDAAVEILVHLVRGVVDDDGAESQPLTKVGGLSERLGGSRVGLADGSNEGETVFEGKVMAEKARFAEREGAVEVSSVIEVGRGVVVNGFRLGEPEGGIGDALG